MDSLPEELIVSILSHCSAVYLWRYIRLCNKKYMRLVEDIFRRKYHLVASKDNISELEKRLLPYSCDFIPNIGKYGLLRKLKLHYTPVNIDLSAYTQLTNLDLRN